MNNTVIIRNLSAASAAEVENVRDFFRRKAEKEFRPVYPGQRPPRVSVEGQGHRRHHVVAAGLAVV